MKTIKLEELKDHFDEIISADNEETAIPEDDVIDLANLAEKDEMDDDTVCNDGVFIEESGENLAENEQNETAHTSTKFKSVEDLEKAYNALQKEFTRRCQRLSKLEKELAEQPQMREETPEEWKGKVDKFFKENPHAKPFARAIAEEIVLDGSLRKRKDCLETALTRVLVNTYKAPKDLATDEEFLRNHVLTSDYVKKTVIEDYLKGLRAGKPPVLIGAKGQNTVAPRNKPKTIEEAGKMFCQNSK